LGARPVPRGDAYAVIVGINAYADPQIPKLRYARADAEGIAKVLIDPAVGRFREENVTTLLDENATERGIRTAIEDVSRRAGPADTVVIFFAGHGAPVIVPGTRAADGIEKYLLPHDARAERLRATAISMDEVRKFFGWLESRCVVCFLDCCYSGGAAANTSADTSVRGFVQPGMNMRAQLTDEFLNELAGDGRLIVTACGVNEVSLESDDIRHGVFSFRLIEGLRGAADQEQKTGRVSVEQLYRYVRDHVAKDARAVGGRMQPRKEGSVGGEVYLTQYADPPTPTPSPAPTPKPTPTGRPAGIVLSVVAGIAIALLGVLGWILMHRTRPPQAALTTYNTLLDSVRTSRSNRGTLLRRFEDHASAYELEPWAIRDLLRVLRYEHPLRGPCAVPTIAERSEVDSATLNGVRRLQTQWKSRHGQTRGMEWAKPPNVERVVGISLDSTDLRGVNLRQLDLRGFHRDSVSFVGACLAGANFEATWLDSASFRGATLDSASFMGAKGTGVHFDRSSSRLVNFRQSVLPYAHFDAANLQCANFAKATLDGASFGYSNLTWAYFGGPASLNGVSDWTLVKAFANANFQMHTVLDGSPAALALSRGAVAPSGEGDKEWVRARDAQLRPGGACDLTARRHDNASLG
jgi:uncharacterized protein YjbI with pentapeptide repeats